MATTLAQLWRQRETSHCTASRRWRRISLNEQLGDDVVKGRLSFGISEISFWKLNVLSPDNLSSVFCERIPTSPKCHTPAKL